jgi:hypothetical protein
MSSQNFSLSNIQAAFITYNAANSWLLGMPRAKATDNCCSAFILYKIA